MPTYDDIKSKIISNVESLATENSIGFDGNTEKFSISPSKFNTLFGALAEQRPSPPYKVVSIDVGTNEFTQLYGSSFAPAADRADLGQGPDGTLENHTVIAEVVRGVSTYLDDEWKPKINAAISELNSLIADYNSRFATTFDENLEEVP